MPLNRVFSRPRNWSRLKPYCRSTTTTAVKVKGRERKLTATRQQINVHERGIMQTNATHRKWTEITL